MKQKIVVTGFGPFAGHPINASWQSVKLLPELWSQENNDFDLVIEEIPVQYEFVQTQIPLKWADLNPVFYVHVGVSHIAKLVTLETLGHNKCYNKPDIEGKIPQNECCVDDSEECDELKTSLNVEKIVENINSQLNASKVCISSDAGHYLCDFVFFKSLHSSRGKSLFIHVPPLNQPFSEQELASTIIDVLKEIVKQIQE